MLATFLIATAAVAVAAPFLGQAMGRRAGWVLGPALFALGVALWVASSSNPAPESYTWIPSLGVAFSLRLDGLGLMFSLLVLLVGGAVLTYSARHLTVAPHGNFYGLMSLFAFAMLGLVLADDVVLLFLMWEITTFCSFFLIARSGPPAREPAIRTLLVTGAGGLALLAAAATMAVTVGSTQLTVILASDAWNDTAFAATVAVLLAFAAFAKSAQFPFQAWLPDAMAAATPVSAYLHAAAMVKAGIYLLMRFTSVLGELPLWNAMLISVGLLTAVMGAFAALRRYDLKSMLAYSTVSQLGFLVAAIGIGTPEALVAAAVHTVAHALFKSALFLLTGIIDHQTGTRDIRILGRLHTTMPATTVLFGLAALSMAGVPPLLGFMSKEGIFAAFLTAPGPAWVGFTVATLGVLAAVLTFGYASKMVLGIIGGPAMTKPVKEAAPIYLFPVALPALAGLLVGLWPAPVDRLVYDAGANASGTPVDGYLSLWHGVNTPLVMSLLVMAAGVGLALARTRVDRFVEPLASPISALRIVDKARVGIIRFGDRMGDITRTDSPNRHLAVPIVSLVIIAGVAVATLTDLPAIVGDPTRPFDWVLVGLLVIGVAGAIAARSRVAAIAIIGIVGFGVTLWFLTLGAADVALTQLLVEILTVVVMVLLLRRLPATFRKASKRRAVGAGMIAAVAGAATTLAVFAFTGRRELSPAGEYFLREVKTDTGGTNVVNTILVDFRALDTLGEITVLAMAGVAVLVLVQSRTLLSSKSARIFVSPDSPLRRERDNAVFLRTLSRLVGPLTVVLSLFFLLRGHNAPGGGFIAALIGGAGVALIYLAADSDESARSRLPALALIGSGVVLAVVTGLLGYVDQSFLRPLHFDLFTVHISTAVVFDVGVYLVVIGVVVASLNLLGTPTRRAMRDLDAPPDAEAPTRTASKEQVS